MNQKAFLASLTITGIVSNANANRDTQGAQAVSSFCVVITYHKTRSRVLKRYYYNIHCTMSANNTAGASDTRPVFVCCEIIMSNVISHELVNNCFIIRKRKKTFSTPVPKFLFCFVFVFFSFTRTAYSVRLTNVASGPKWNRKSRVKYRLLESRILQLVLIPSRRPAPKSTFIPIPSAKVHVAPAHFNISSNELRTYMALICCK